MTEKNKKRVKKVLFWTGVTALVATVTYLGVKYYRNNKASLPLADIPSGDSTNVVPRPATRAAGTRNVHRENISEIKKALGDIGADVTYSKPRRDITTGAVCAGGYNVKLHNPDDYYEKAEDIWDILNKVLGVIGCDQVFDRNDTDTGDFYLQDFNDLPKNA